MLYKTKQKKIWDPTKWRPYSKEEEYTKVKGGKNQNETWFAENREAKVGRFKRSIFIIRREQEVLRLKISMHNTKRVTSLNDANNGLDNLSRISLTVMTFLRDSIKQLTTFAKLHHKVHASSILVRAVYPDNVGVFRQVMHYLDLPQNVIAIFLTKKLPFGYRFAGKLLTRLAMSTEESGSKLSLSEHTIKNVIVFQVLGLVRENPTGS